jgi:hypothetical protein
MRAAGGTMFFIYMIAALLIALGFFIGTLVGERTERAWWRRNLNDQEHMPPGIQRRLR